MRILSVDLASNRYRVPGAQAEPVRVPLADGTLYVLAAGNDNALVPSLPTLSDVMGTLTWTSKQLID